MDFFFDLQKWALFTKGKKTEYFGTQNEPVSFLKNDSSLTRRPRSFWAPDCLRLEVTI